MPVTTSITEFATRYHGDGHLSNEIRAQFWRESSKIQRFSSSESDEDSSDDELFEDAMDIHTSDDQDNWEEYNVDVFGGDDYHRLPRSTHIDEVKKICKEKGSRAFVTKDNCQYYIRSPPSVKKNRDYISLKCKIEERISLKKFSKYKTYLLDY